MVALDSLLKSSIQSSILVAKPNFHHYLHTLGLAPLLQATEESLHDYRDQGEVTFLQLIHNYLQRNHIHWRVRGPVRAHISSRKTFESMLLREFSSVTPHSMDTIYTFIGAMSAVLPLHVEPWFLQSYGPLLAATVNACADYLRPELDDGNKHNLSAVVSLLTSTYTAPEAFSDEYEVEYLLVPPVPTSSLATVALPETTSTATVCQTASVHAASLEVNQEESLANLKTRQNPKRVTACRRFSPLRLTRKASRGVRKVRIAFSSMNLSSHSKAGCFRALQPRELRSASLSSRVLRKSQKPLRRRINLCAEPEQRRTRVPHKTFPSAILSWP
ncbi:hypothetical protein R3P38DRAFT_2971462 [Favolaschia claudopus]|uniref:Uncharacterized protein n=1 Tax=Favolaschia claudopus TaxID=2862362 RepID=A0AAW0B1Q2_9AGAR